ncbi:MAG: hypothetical protein GXP45_00070 [bacterium]|nr:hypothetical protein [bacterium]
MDYFVSDETKTKYLGDKTVDVDISVMIKVIFGKEVVGFDQEIEKILEGLGFEIREKKEDIWTVSVPLWRSPEDIEIQEDIFEEVARIYGYDRIESIPIKSFVNHVPYQGLVKMKRYFENFLVRNAQFDELETYPWVDNKLLALFDGDTASLYHLQNPLSIDAPCLRDNLRENLMSYIVKNAKFFDTIRIFDIGQVWSKKNQELLKKKKKTSLDKRYAENYVAEHTELGAIIYTKHIENREEDSIFSLQNILVSALAELSWKEEDFRLETTDLSIYHPKKQANIYIRDVLVGSLGQIHPLLLAELKLPEKASCSYLQLNLDILASLEDQQESNKYTFETLKDQIVWRDLSFVIDEDKSYREILDYIKAMDSLSSLEVFDLYQ